MADKDECGGGCENPGWLFPGCMLELIGMFFLIVFIGGCYRGCCAETGGLRGGTQAVVDECKDLFGGAP